MRLRGKRSVRRVCESVRELLLAGQQGLFLSRRFHATARAVAAFPESCIESDYEQHCLGTPNSGRSYARRADASRSCPRSWMSPSVGSILGEQRDQSPDQCRLYARLHRTGASSTGRNSVFDTDTRSPIALVEMLFASEGKIRLQLPLRGKSNCNLPLRGKSRML